MNYRVTGHVRFIYEISSSGRCGECYLELKIMTQKMTRVDNKREDASINCHFSVATTT